MVDLRPPGEHEAQRMRPAQPASVAMEMFSIRDQVFPNLHADSSCEVWPAYRKELTRALPGVASLICHFEEKENWSEIICLDAAACQILTLTFPLTLTFEFFFREIMTLSSLPL